VHTLGEHLGSRYKSGDALPHLPRFATHPVHTLMARTGSFPVHVATWLIEKYAAAGSVILDPFCGKGTTLLAGRLMGFSSYGTDIAPEAVVCTRAKMVPVDLRELLTYIDSLNDQPCSEKVPGNVRLFFHHTTLSDLLAVRRRLLSDLRASDSRLAEKAVVGLAACLGILHGHTSLALSLPCSHAYSMSPEYVRRFAREHNLRRPRRDVVACLKAKISKCFGEALPPAVVHDVRRGSAQHIGIVFSDLLGKVDLIQT